jgi:WD40 repeat protein
MAASRHPVRRSALGASLACAVVLVIMAAGPAAGSPDRPIVSPPSGTQLWLSNYSGLGMAQASAIATSPSGGTVFVTGTTVTSSTPQEAEYATVAYDAATGAPVWASTYAGPDGRSYATALAVSPDGTRLFVTGASAGQSGTTEYFATIAYDASTGARLWVRRHDVPHNSGGIALALSPDGGVVFVTGSSGFGHRAEFRTVAYSAASGHELWRRSYNGSDSSYNSAAAIAVDPDGKTVVVTGSGYRSRTGTAFETVAYNAMSGKQVWARRYNRPAKRTGAAASLAFSPSGGAVYVTGYASPTNSGRHSRYVTIAYDAATGRTRWVNSYARARRGVNAATSVSVDPSGHRVFVTGESQGATTRLDYATVAYNANSGKRLWISRYNSPANGRDLPTEVAVSPGGSRVCVTGYSTGVGSNYDYATVCYGAVSGHQIWVQRYNGPANGEDLAQAIAIAPNGTVYVTGTSEVDNQGDYGATTIAYQG